MHLFCSNKDHLEISKLILSLVKTTIFVPAAFVLGWAVFIGLVASLFGLSGTDHALNFIGAVTHNWILITLHFLLLPYFIATIYFNVVRPAASRENLVTLFSLSAINACQISIWHSLSELSPVGKTCSHFHKHVSGFSPKLE